MKGGCFYLNRNTFLFFVFPFLSLIDNVILLDINMDHTFKYERT